MTTKQWALALLAGGAMLTACGEKKSDEAPSQGAMADEPSANDTTMAAQDAAPDATDVVAVPDIPVDPLIALNAQKSATFLAMNAGRDGVRVLDDGMQIETLVAGSGDTPDETDFVLFHYKGMKIDGTVFDDSTTLEEPLTVQSFNQIPVPGMPTGLAQMKEGETAKVYLPPSLAFGEEGLPGLFEPNEVVIFELQLVEVVKEEETARREEIVAQQEALMAEQQAAQEAAMEAQRAQMAEVAAANLAESVAFLTAKAAEEGITKTDSGLLYQVMEDGGDGPTPDPWDTVKVHYLGTLPDGTKFDSSYDRGEPIDFGLSQVISGWTEGVALMNVGDKYKFFIPPELGYGERGAGGTIGPNNALVFEVELLGITENPAPEGAE